MKKKERKKTKRSMMKYPALNPGVNLKTRADQLEFDYLDKLSDEEKDWLNRTMDEYVNTNFDHKGERVHPKVIKSKRVKSTGRMKKIDIAKNEAEHRNNDRNACILTRAKASGKLVVGVADTDYNYEGKFTENDMIERIDFEAAIEQAAKEMHLEVSGENLAQILDYLNNTDSKTSKKRKHS